MTTHAQPRWWQRDTIPGYILIAATIASFLLLNGPTGESFHHLLETAFGTIGIGEGAHALTATSTITTGTSAPTLPFNLTIDTIAPGQPGAGGNGGIDLITDDVGLVTGPIANGGTTDDTTPTFSGGGQEPGSTVTIFDNGAQIGTATANGAGAFSTSVTLALGGHPLTVKQTSAGQTSAASPAVSPCTLRSSALAGSAAPGLADR